MYRRKIAFIASVGLVAPWATAGTLTSSVSAWGSRNNSTLDIQDAIFTDAAAGAGTATTIGDGLIEAYQLVSKVGVSAGALGTSGTGGSVAVEDSAGGIFTTPTVAAGKFNANPAKEATIIDGAGNTLTDSQTGVRVGELTGSIDLSAYASGSIYFFAGSVGGNASNGAGTAIATVTGTLTDGSTPLSSQANASSGHSKLFVYRFDFDTTGGFSTFDYSYTNVDADGSKGRYYGVVVDAAPIPEPGSLALIGLGGLLLVRRRRA